MAAIRPELCLEIGGAIEQPDDLNRRQVGDGQQVPPAQRPRFGDCVHASTLSSLDLSDLARDARNDARRWAHASVVARDARVDNPDAGGPPQMGRIRGSAVISCAGRNDDIGAEPPASVYRFVY